MSVFTVGGRQLLAQLMQAENFFLAVGEGDAAWDVTPVAPTGAATDLVDKVGVTRLRDIDFVEPDAGGLIIMADGSKWTVSVSPTRYVYLNFKLDAADANGSTVREAGIFHGTTLDGGVPGGQTYIPDADVNSYGTLIHLDRFNSIVRDGTLEQEFSYIITL